MRAIVIVLHKREVTLHCTNESMISVSLWYEDPNLEYAKGKHAALFGFALLVLLFFVLPYTLFLLCHPVLEKYLSKYKLFKFWSHFKPIIDSYSGPMKDDYWYWSGILLGARIPILLIVTFMQNKSPVLLLAIAAIILSLSFIFWWCLQEKIAQHYWILVLNQLVYQNSFVIQLLLLLKVQYWSDTILVYVSLLLVLLQLLSIIFTYSYHAWNVMIL